MKPRIAVTTWTEVRARAPYTLVSRNYLESVVAGGGRPVLVAPDLGGSPADDLDGVQGLLVTGGSDLWPPEYGEDPHPAVGLCDPVRDRWERALVVEARARGLAVLGICRGHQLINVAHGGTLWQDLPSQRPSAVGHDPAHQGMDELWHRLTLAPGDHLVRRALGEAPRVNSFHHQAVKDLGAGLVATAWAADGVIEAFEAVEGPWLAGLQFHPEALTARYPAFVALFAEFVAAAGALPPGPRLF